MCVSFPAQDNACNCQELSAAVIEPTDRPNTVPWPPLLYGGSALIAMLLQSYAPLSWPLPVEWGKPLLVAGSLMFIAGFATDIGTMLLFTRRKANFLPHKAATQLITDGPFRYSRNPIYVGNTLMLSGAGVAFSSLWLLLAAGAAAVATHFLAILREEKHLAAKFGSKWDAYAAITPRWLIF
jgi:protein-S-isoprenylcysteine O-methyltransferase Ste14